MIKRGITSALLLLGAMLIFAPSQTAHAGVTGFIAGRIIDDSIFTNTSSMSAADIQRFFESKVPVCDTNGTQMYNSYQTRAQFAATLGKYPPFTCIKDYVTGGKTAAQIVYDVSQQYQINPQVLVVLLQKEQGLITDTWPYDSQYRSATGYGCPDTAACNSTYYGFENQVNWAAKMYRAILNASPTWYTPYILGNNYIQYNPNTACGGSVVNIQNRATQALYNYTPYQPNQATLDAGWGTASCGAYGNRNFYLYFTSWFGPTLAPDYSWELVSQYAFTDDTKTTPVGLNNLKPGQRVYIGFTARNNGNMTWSNTGSNPVRVGTVRDYGRSSAFVDPTWISAGRPATMKEPSVNPGQTGTFEFWITAPETSVNQFKEYFSLLAEGKTWMPDLGLYFGISVEPARYNWQLVGQYAYEDSTKTTLTVLSNQYPGQKKYVAIQIRNTGNVTWKNSGSNPLRLGITNPMERFSAFMGEGWLGPSRPATMKEPSALPGEIATFEFWMQAPTNKSGVFREYFSPLIENKLWLADIGLNFAASVVNPSYSWALTSQYAYTDDTKTSLIGLGGLAPGQRVYVGFTAKNTGNVPWFNVDGKNPIDVGTTNPIDRMSKYCTTGWLGCNRPTRMKEAVVNPGQTATFEFWIQAPTTSGNYLEYFNLVAEQASWMNNLGFNYAISVR